MKKIIKITALILALICIGTSCAACGKNQSSPEIQASGIQLTENPTLSDKEAADAIRQNILMVRENIDLVNPENSSSGKWAASSLFPINKLTGEPVDGGNTAFKVQLHESLRCFQLIFLNMYHRTMKNNGKTVITIHFPIEIKNTSYGVISEDRKSVIAEYYYDASNYPETVYLEPGITIFY